MKLERPVVRKLTTYVATRAYAWSCAASTFERWENTRRRDVAQVDALLPHITWYQATRHTFASQFVMNGGSIERLRLILGHSSVLVTERYAHLNPKHFGERELSAVTVDLSRPAGSVLELGHDLGTNADEGPDQGATVDLATG